MLKLVKSENDEIFLLTYVSEPLLLDLELIMLNINFWYRVIDHCSFREKKNNAKFKPYIFDE